MEPVVKWAGGKRQLLKEISRLVPPFRRYYEPFLGGGAVLLHLAPDMACLNDSNAELINVYNIIKSDYVALINELDAHRRKNSETYFYKVRGQDREEYFTTMSDVCRAARFIYLNKTCYNGLYRVNSKGFFNVPYGKYKNPLFYSADNLEDISKYLNKPGMEIRAGNYLDALKDIQGDDFVYFDPPYEPLNQTSNFTSYTSSGFTSQNQKELKEVCDALTSKGVKFLLSNSNAKLIRELYSTYNIRNIKAKRYINCNGDGRGQIKELLISNY